VDALEIASVEEVNWTLLVWMCGVQEMPCVGLQKERKWHSQIIS